VASQSPERADLVLGDRDGPIGTVTLNQPAKHNAMTLAMWEELRRTVEELDDDPEIRIVVVRGMGTAAFSAGADVSEFLEKRANAEQNESYTRAYVDAQDRIAAARKPTIALIHGVCAGGGTGIALACRLRFCDDRLRFSIPAARLGVVYDFGSVARLVRCVGESVAYDILVSGRPVGADEALRLRLVNDVHPFDELEARVVEYARRVAEHSPISIEGTGVVVDAVGDPGNDALRREAREFEHRSASSDDYQEGIRAFLEKRKPVFSGS
jgi:enoyl-CoA hydratase/carnithine racemase